jgi:hypothetical protein
MLHFNLRGYGGLNLQFWALLADADLRVRLAGVRLPENLEEGLVQVRVLQRSGWPDLGIVFSS